MSNGVTYSYSGEGESDVYSPETANPRYQSGHQILLDGLINQVLSGERHPFLDYVRGIESGGAIKEGKAEFPEGQAEAVSPTGARGVYQFLPSTVGATIERGEQLGINPSFLS